MVISMRTNLDHDVFINKGKSIALAQQVDDFLKAQGKSEPDQVPFGHSGHYFSCKSKGIDPYSVSLRDVMTRSVEETHAEKKTFQPQPILETTEQKRRIHNKNARIQAYENGKSEFIGICIHHKEQTFRIKARGKDHICLVCLARNIATQNSKRKLKKDLV